MMKKENQSKPPFTFLRRLLTTDEIDDVDGCFEEMYTQVAAKKGPGYAKGWIFLQALKSLPGFLSHWIYWKMLMLKNALNVAWRGMLKNKGVFLIKVFGLASGIACGMAVILYVANELTYDAYHPGHGRVYRIANRRVSALGEFGSASTAGPLAPAIRAQLSQAEAVARVIPPFENADHVLVARDESRFFEKRVWFADAEIFRILRIPFLEGSARTALTAPRAVVISQGLARKYFGGLPPLGRSLSVEIDYDTGAAVIEELQVTGVVRDAPANTHFKYDMLISMPTLRSRVPELDQDWGEYHRKYTYVKLRPGVEPGAFAANLRPFAEQVIAAARSRGSSLSRNEYFPQPLASLHLGSNLDNEIEPPGNMYYLYVYSIAALLILLIGIVNFVNLSATLSANRSREVGIRKTLGGSRADLVFQFLGESLAVTFFAFLAGLALLSLLLGRFNRMAGTELSLRSLGQPVVLASLLALFFAVAFSAGMYPAVILSRFKPVATLKNQIVPGKGGNAVQRLLVLAQFAVSIFLVVCALVVFRQLTFMKGKALGFSIEQKLALPVRSNLAHFRASYQAIKGDFLKNPEIIDATVSSSVPGEAISGGYYLQRGDSFSPSKAKRLHILTVDHDFIRAYGITMVAGRPFRESSGNDEASAYIVNEAGARELGHTRDSVLGTRWTAHYHRRTKAVVGVTADFHFQGMKDSAAPLLLDLEASLLRVITLTLDRRRIGPALAAAQETWGAHFPGVPFEYEFLDKAFGRVYQYEERMGRLLGLISVMGVAIAFLGLYGMVAFYAQARKKEIGIRRALGASTAAVALLLTREFVVLVFAAGAAAVPLAWLASSRWLMDFAYRIRPGFPVFAFAFLSAFLIAMAVALLHTLRAARANPADALRCE